MNLQSLLKQFSERLFVPQIKHFSVQTENNQNKIVLDFLSSNRKSKLNKSQRKNKNEHKSKVETRPSYLQYFSITNQELDKMIQREKIISSDYYIGWKNNELNQRPEPLEKQVVTQRRQFIQQKYLCKPFLSIDWQLTISQLKISKSDMDTLKPTQFLNGQIINFYLRLSKQRLFDKNISEKIFIMSTYFFTKLMKGYLNYQHLDQPISKQFYNIIRQNYKGVKKWIKDQRLFQTYYIIIPIHLIQHWVVIVVINLPSIVNSSSKCFMIYLDSLGIMNQLVIQTVRIYLKSEFQDKNIVQNPQQIFFNKTTIPCYQLLIPRQTNLYDCGIYMLLNIQSIFLNPSILHKNFKRINNRKHLHLFCRPLAYSMRSRLINLFNKLSRCKKDEQQQRFIFQDYLCQRYEIQKDVILDIDYDHVDLKQFKKFMIRYQKHSVQISQDDQFKLMLVFCSRTQTNYFEKQTK